VRFAGISIQFASRSYCLPCRRSWVRIPPAALQKACICRPFQSRQSPCSSASGRTDSGLAVRRSSAASRKTPALQADHRSSELKSFCRPAGGPVFACCGRWPPVPANGVFLRTDARRLTSSRSRPSGGESAGFTRFRKRGVSGSLLPVLHPCLGRAYAPPRVWRAARRFCCSSIAGVGPACRLRDCGPASLAGCRHINHGRARAECLGRSWRSGAGTRRGHEGLAWPRLGEARRTPA
jgi:hypothetical protein